MHSLPSFFARGQIESSGAQCPLQVEILARNWSKGDARTTPWFIRTGAFPWSSERVPVVDHYTSLKVQPQSISAKHQVLLKQTQRNQGKCPSPLRGCHGNTETNRGTLSGDPLAYFACHLGFSLFCFWVCLGPLWCPVPRTKLASKIGETHTHTHKIGAWDA